MPDAPLTAARGPWKGGYTSARPAFLVDPDQLVGNTDGTDTNASRDVVIDPQTGGVSRRGGCSILNDTLDGNRQVVTGLLNAGINSTTSRKLFALDSKSLTDGYPTLAGLFGSDDASEPGTNFPAADVGHNATIWLNSTNSGASTNALKNYSLLEEFGTTHYAGTYSGAHTASSFKLRVVPIWVDSGDGVYNRGALTGTAGTDKFNQQFLACGSRSVVQTQDHIYAPNLRATPWRWNKRFNESDSSGSEINRIYPTGPLPPLVPPTVDTMPAASANNSTWLDGDTYYISVLFQMADGSYSAPFIPRAPNSTLTSGLGFVTVGTIGGGNKYQYVPYINIPLGPDGTVARIILRTPKQTRTAAGDTVTVSPLDLRIVGVLRNNTQTAYNDYGGDDDSLLEDDDVVRFDYMMPRRARHIGTGDQRCIISYTLPNTAAILLAPVGVTASRDRNFLDTDNSCYNGAAAFLVRITSTQLELHYNATAAANFAGAGNAKAFAFATYTTLDALVDAINATVVGDNCKQWAAQLAPGVDGTVASTSLTKTTLTVADATTSGANANLTSASGGFGPIGVGMKVTGTNITAGTYVRSKTSDSALTLSTAATGVAGVGLTFYSDTGDEAIESTATFGYMRVFSQTYPALLHLKASALPGYDNPDKSSVYFTVSSPGAATSGISLAPNAWVAGNRRLPHSSPRQLHGRSCTGIVDIEGAAVVAFSDGIHMFANQRGANSGEDFDYRLFTVNDTRGCISYLGLTSGNGWAAYPTTEGIVVTDKNRREFVISNDIHNASDGTGDLFTEIGLSAASVAADTDDQHFSMAVMGSKLVVGVRGVSPANARYLEYDFSPGIEASGVEEMLNPETKRSYIWSPPAIYNADAASGALKVPGAMGSIRNASGRLDYISTDDYPGGSTNHGRIDRIHTAASTGDNLITSFVSYATMAPWLSSDFMLLSPQRMEVTHRCLQSTFDVTYLQFATDQLPTFNATLQRKLKRCGVEFGGTSHTLFQRQIVPIDQTQRPKTDCFWAQWQTSQFTSSGVPDRIWRVVLQYSELENTPRQAGEN